MTGTVYFVKIEVVEAVVLPYMCVRKRMLRLRFKYIYTSLCELICVDCYYKNNDNRIKSQCVRCIVYYRPPKDDIEEMTEFCDLLGKLIYDDKQILILGDFNLPHVKWKSYCTPINNIVEELCLNNILELNLFKFVLQPTRSQIF